jgi:general secretion pathway protein A
MEFFDSIQKRKLLPTVQTPNPMYTHYFRLTEKPFSIAPDVSFLYMGEQHREALAHLLYGVSSDDCFVLLTGDVGMGKSTVCRCLVAQLPQKTAVAVVANPCISVLELLTTICTELGIEVDEETDGEQPYLDALNAYLLEAHANEQIVALIVDEAQNTSLDQLEQLCSLATLKSENRQLLKIVLIGQTELSQILNQQDASQISKYITSRYHLLALDQKSSAGYVQHRLAVAGAREKIFSKASLVRVFELSHGIPRFIDVLCDEALQTTYMRRNYLVTASDVDDAAEKVLGNVVEKKLEITRKQLWRKVLCGLALFLVVGGALSWYFSQTVVPPVREKIAPAVAPSQKAAKSTPVVVKVEITEEETAASEKTKSTIHIVPLEVNE